MKPYDYWKARFAQNDLLDFSQTAEGRLWLKLRSIERKDLLIQFCSTLDLEFKSGVISDIWKRLNESATDREALDTFMRCCQLRENESIDATFETIRSNLYKMTHFHWGGGFRNSLDKAIVSRYVKTPHIIPFQQLEAICDGELRDMTHGYLLNSWYNYWTSILIENVFRRNEAVMPAYGKIKNVDFFVKDFPFDLKVTYIPKEYAKSIRKELGFTEPIRKLRRYANHQNIPFDLTADEEEMQYEISERISDASTPSGLALLSEIRREWQKVVKSIISQKQKLIQWLYENQGDMRFGAENRVFLVLVDLDAPEASWKLKRNVDLIRPCVNEWIAGFDRKDIESLHIYFTFNDKEYQTYADAIFVLKDIN